MESKISHLSHQQTPISKLTPGSHLTLRINSLSPSSSVAHSLPFTPPFITLAPLPHTYQSSLTKTSFRSPCSPYHSSVPALLKLTLLSEHSPRVFPQDHSAVSPQALRIFRNSRCVENGLDVLSLISLRLELTLMNLDRSSLVIFIQVLLVLLSVY